MTREILAVFFHDMLLVLIAMHRTVGISLYMHRTVGISLYMHLAVGILLYITCSSSCDVFFFFIIGWLIPSFSSCE